MAAHSPLGPRFPWSRQALVGAARVLHVALLLVSRPENEPRLAVRRVQRDGPLARLDGVGDLPALQRAPARGLLFRGGLRIELLRGCPLPRRRCRVGRRRCGRHGDRCILRRRRDGRRGGRCVLRRCRDGCGGGRCALRRRRGRRCDGFGGRRNRRGRGCLRLHRRGRRLRGRGRGLDGRLHGRRGCRRHGDGTPRSLFGLIARQGALHERRQAERGCSRHCKLHVPLKIRPPARDRGRQLERHPGVPLLRVGRQLVPTVHSLEEVVVQVHRRVAAVVPGIERLLHRHVLPRRGLGSFGHRVRRFGCGVGNLRSGLECRGSFRRPGRGDGFRLGDHDLLAVRDAHLRVGRPLAGPASTPLLAHRFLRLRPSVLVCLSDVFPEWRCPSRAVSVIFGADPAGEVASRPGSSRRMSKWRARGRGRKDCGRPVPPSTFARHPCPKLMRAPPTGRRTLAQRIRPAERRRPARPS